MLTSLVTDYFVRSQIDNTDDDSESDSSDGDVDTDHQLKIQSVPIVMKPGSLDNSGDVEYYGF